MRAGAGWLAQTIIIPQGFLHEPVVTTYFADGRSSWIPEIGAVVPRIDIGRANLSSPLPNPANGRLGFARMSHAGAAVVRSGLPVELRRLPLALSCSAPRSPRDISSCPCSHHSWCDCHRPKTWHSPVSRRRQRLKDIYRGERGAEKKQ